jgi:hypothetical protein
MNMAHFHLMLAHIPVLLVPLGTVFLLIALWRVNSTLRVSALGVFTVAALVAVSVFLLGEGAEEQVEHALGVVESAIEPHEESAELALWLSVSLGLLSIAELLRLRFKPEMLRLLVLPVLLTSVICSASLAYTAQQGGRIRHPEAFLADGLDGGAKVRRASADDD